MIGRTGLLLTAILLAISGCSSPPEGPLLDQDKVTKVTGKLMINGKAEQQVMVKLNRIGGPDPNAKSSGALTISALTDADGSFAISTYGGGDGAPDGEYAVTFQWGMRNLLGGNYTGDKFGGKYSNAEKSEKKITVAGVPVDMGVIELTAPEGASFEDGGPKILGEENR